MTRRLNREAGKPATVSAAEGSDPDLSNLRRVFITNSAPGGVVLGRSPSDELEIGFVKAVHVTRRVSAEEDWRFITLGIRREGEVLRVSIRGDQSDSSGRMRWPVGSGMRILVPEDVRLEFVSSNGTTVCRDFPAVLVLRSRESDMATSD